MKKRFFSLVLALIMAFSACSVFADTVEEPSESVEISFCVGDETLLINGTAVSVEKPYVVGKGVTLVPVRVITEAFGAEVGWIAETRTITLDYPDVKIILQIDNPIAEVNGRAETLLSAPELTANGFTMVPLRFISENFGAEVSYDEETKRITVKKLVGNMGNVVEETIDSKKVGDSYYGWSMENSGELLIGERYFDGTHTSFLYGESGLIEIDIEPMYSGYDFEDSFFEWKEEFKGKTLSEASTDTSVEGVNKIHVRGKDSEIYYDIYEIQTSEYIYNVWALIDINSEKDEFFRIVSTFSSAFDEVDTYDLSNVKDGYRRFETPNMNYSFDVPADYLFLSPESAETSLYFEKATNDNPVSSITVEIYSADEEIDALRFLKRAYDENKASLNENLVKFSKITEKVYTQFKSYEYSYQYGTDFEIKYVRDVFFYNGEYIYNFVFEQSLLDENAQEFVDRILNSIAVGDADTEVIGTILYNNEKKQGTYTYDGIKGVTMEIPKSFEIQAESQLMTILYNDTTFFMISKLSDKDYHGNMLISELENAVKDLGVRDVETYSRPALINIGEKQFAKTVLTFESNGDSVFYEIYLTCHNGSAYMFMVTYPLLFYSKNARSETEAILESLNFYY